MTGVALSLYFCDYTFEYRLPPGTQFIHPVKRYYKTKKLFLSDNTRQMIEVIFKHNPQDK